MEEAFQRKVLQHLIEWASPRPGIVQQALANGLRFGS